MTTKSTKNRKIGKGSKTNATVTQKILEAQRKLVEGTRKRNEIQIIVNATH